MSVQQLLFTQTFCSDIAALFELLFFQQTLTFAIFIESYIFQILFDTLGAFFTANRMQNNFVMTGTSSAVAFGEAFKDLSHINRLFWDRF
jgi:hypothetical protein